MTNDERARLEEAKLEQLEREMIRRYLGVDASETEGWTRRDYERELTSRLEGDLHA
jgi:hypothetical protein